MFQVTVGRLWAWKRVEFQILPSLQVHRMKRSQSALRTHGESLQAIQYNLFVFISCSTELLLSTPETGIELRNGFVRNVSVKRIKENWNSWFQTFDVFGMLYSSFWVITRRLNFRRWLSEHSLCSIFINGVIHHLWRWNILFRNVGT